MRVRTVRRILPLLLLLHANARSPLWAQQPGQAEALPASWDAIAPGVWRATIGTPEAVSLLEAAGVEPRMSGLARMGPVAFPLAGEDLVARRVDGHLVLRFPLGTDEELYGLGLNFKDVAQRGTVKTLHVDHYGGADNGRTHAPVPFYVSSAGYGVLVDVARYVTVYAGTAVRADSPHPPRVRDRNTDPLWSAQPTSDAVEMRIPAPGATVYVFGGPLPLDVVRRYNLYAGGGTLPPKWGLGFLHRVPTGYSAAQVLAEVDEFATRNYPLDVVGLEPGWQSKSYPCTFVWDSTRFAEPKAFLAQMAAQGLRVNLWFNPYVSPESPLIEAVRTKSGSHTVWTGLVPDYTLPDVARSLVDHFKRHHVDLGVSGYKIDEVDGYDQWLWPDHATFPSGLSGEQMRQVYGLRIQSLIAGLYRASGKRTYGLVRGTNAGASRLPFVLYNDAYSHREFITALINSGFIGVLWTPEVRASKSGEEWLRRMQSVCLSPLAMLNAWADGTKPWSFPEVEDQVREVMQLRVRLLPYLYTTFAQYAFEGTPPIRPLPLLPDFADTAGQDEATLRAMRRHAKDQFMVGDHLLVAPMFAGEEAREVVLPPGRWYDFYTGAYVGAGEVVQVSPGLSRIPLFVRDGGIIPLIETARQIPKPGTSVPLEVRHYGERDGTGLLYDDDGDTFEYERGVHTWTTLRVRRDETGRLRGDPVDAPSGSRPFGYRSVRWRFMTGAEGG